jgi:DNA modification methylase
MRKEIIGNCTLYLGDCRDILPTLGKVDAVVTDPPYGVDFSGKTVKMRTGGTKKTSGGYETYVDSEENLKRTVIPAIKWCIDNCKRVSLTPGIRCAFLYPRPDDIGCFYSAGGNGMGRWGFTTSQPILYYGKDPYLEHRQGSRASSCGQTYPNDANESGHPCAKPLKQMMWWVNRATWETDIVLDPFMGSGTTGVACVKMNRSFIGIELDPDYFEIACQRIRDAYAQPDMFYEADKHA